MFRPLPRVPPAVIGSPAQGKPEVIRDSPLSAVPDTMGSLSGSVPPWRSEWYIAMSGYDNDQRSVGEVSYETFRRPSLDYEPTQQPDQNYFQIYDVGRFSVAQSPTLAARPDMPVSPTNASDTEVVDQYISCDSMANSATYAPSSLTVDMTASLTHGYYHFNPYLNHYYPLSVVPPPSHMPPSSHDASPTAPATFAAPGSSESSASCRSSPVRTRSAPHPLASSDNGPLAADHDGHLVDNLTSEPFFYPCSFDNCQGWISDDLGQMRDHLAIHGVHLRGDPDSPITCRWEGCTARSMKKGNFLRHVFTHFGGRWQCSACKKSYSRSHCASAHIKDSEKCFGGTPTKLVSPKAHRRQMFGDKVMLVKVLGG
ncbi:hypothetical protein EDD16DRAFT_1657112 [Pisolithus croceorrhizus]|nr:hypothetical protein EV401DRAFT_1033355 [Pisolithus croceorrhizus]KAI6099939.1 hypothetical protein EDD16DRAFT_1657112 [Pisolithus croceorrhizus]